MYFANKTNARIRIAIIVIMLEISGVFSYTSGWLGDPCEPLELRTTKMSPVGLQWITLIIIYEIIYIADPSTKGNEHIGQTIWCKITNIWQALKTRETIEDHEHMKALRAYGNSWCRRSLHIMWTPWSIMGPLARIIDVKENDPGQKMRCRAPWGIVGRWAPIDFKENDRFGL